MNFVEAINEKELIVADEQINEADVNMNPNDQAQIQVPYKRVADLPFEEKAAVLTEFWANFI